MLFAKYFLTPLVRGRRAPSGERIMHFDWALQCFRVNGTSRVQMIMKRIGTSAPFSKGMKWKILTWESLWCTRSVPNLYLLATIIRLTNIPVSLWRERMMTFFYTWRFCLVAVFWYARKQGGNSEVPLSMTPTLQRGLSQLLESIKVVTTNGDLARNFSRVAISLFDDNLPWLSEPWYFMPVPSV